MTIKNPNAPRLVEQVAQQLREQHVDAAVSGGALPPVRELAAALNVSIATVRAAQALLAQRGLVTIRHGSGVTVAGQSMPKWVGIVSELDLLTPGTSVYFRTVAHAVREQLEARGCPAELYIGRSQADEHRQTPTCRRLVADVCSGQVAGLVMLAVPETSAWVDFMKALTVPSVGALTPYTAGPDRNRLLHVAVAALRQQGGTRLATLGWGLNPAIVQEAATANGMEFRPGWFSQDLHPQKRGSGWEEFREIWGAHADKPDALLLADDHLLADSARAIGELGIRVPEQLRVAAYSNRGEAFPDNLPATRIEIDPVDTATALVDRLVRLLTGERVPAGNADVPFRILPPALAPVNAYARG